MYFTSSCPSAKEAIAGSQGTKLELKPVEERCCLDCYPCSIVFSYFLARPACSGLLTYLPPLRFWPDHTVPSIPQHLSMTPSLVGYPLQLKLHFSHRQPLLASLQGSSNLPQSAKSQIFLTTSYLQNQYHVQDSQKWFAKFYCKFDVHAALNPLSHNFHDLTLRKHFLTDFTSMMLVFY